MTTLTLRLTLLPGMFAVCQMDASASVPEWAFSGNVCSMTRTPDELSIVCSQANVPVGVKCESGWRCFKVEGPFDFSVVGVIASLAMPLAQAGISIFVVSTYETDYLMVKEGNIDRTIKVLADAGHPVTIVSG